MHSRRRSISRHTTPLAKACNLLMHHGSQTNHCCAQRLASATPNMTCHPPSDLSSRPPLCHRSKLKLKVCSRRILPILAFGFSLLRVCGTASPGLHCLARLHHAFLGCFQPLEDCQSEHTPTRTQQIATWLVSMESMTIVYRRTSLIDFIKAMRVECACGHLVPQTLIK